VVVDEDDCCCCSWSLLLLLSLVVPTKKFKNASASMVAEQIMTRKSGRFRRIFFKSPNKTSELILRSWASSTMTTEYCDKRGSCKVASRNKIPSVTNLILVCDGHEQSSNRTVYPTVVPSAPCPTSWATRCAKV